jgi:hypothetical protein
MATKRQAAARARFARQAKKGTGKVGRKAKSSARQRKRRR